MSRTMHRDKRWEKATRRESKRAASIPCRLVKMVRRAIAERRRYAVSAELLLRSMQHEGFHGNV